MSVLTFVKGVGVLAAITLGLAAMTPGSAVVAQAPAVTAISGATVIGVAAPPIQDAVIVTEGSRITRVGPRTATSIPAGATLIDARGKFVMPGLADMHNHVHSGGLGNDNPSVVLSVLLAYGVTMVFNPSSSLADFAGLQRATAAETVPFPRFFGTGPIVTVAGDSLGAQVGAPTPRTADEARTAVATLKAAGVHAIKVARDDVGWASRRRSPVMPLDVLTALIDQAHRDGLKVYAHAPGLAHAKEALRAGVDGLLHGIIDEPVDQEFLDLLRRNRAVYVPTLSLYEDVADVTGWARRQSAQDDRQALAPLADSFTAPSFVSLFDTFFDNHDFTKGKLTTQRANLKAVADAGVPVVMGTDSGFFGIAMGLSSQVELSLMVEAGMTPDAVLRAATFEAARMIGRDRDFGSIEVGKAADLLVLDASPLDDIRNVRRINRVMRGGVVYDPAGLLKSVRLGPPPPAGR